MARITVEDCIDKFPSRFELVLVASNRARKLFAGENTTLEIDNDKNTVIALREIAEETITKEQLKNDLISEYQTNTFSEDEDLSELEDNSDENEIDENAQVASEEHHIDENENSSNKADSSQTSEGDTEILADEDKIQNKY